MQELKAKVALKLSSGNIKLDAKLAKRLSAGLKATDKKDVFEIVAPIQLKAGTVFFYDGDMNPALEVLVEIPEEEKAEPKKKPAE